MTRSYRQPTILKGNNIQLPLWHDHCVVICGHIRNVIINELSFLRSNIHLIAKWLKQFWQPSTSGQNQPIKDHTINEIALLFYAYANTLFNHLIATSFKQTLT